MPAAEPPTGRETTIRSKHHGVENYFLQKAGAAVTDVCKNDVCLLSLLSYEISSL